MSLWLEDFFYFGHASWLTVREMKGGQRIGGFLIILWFSRSPSLCAGLGEVIPTRRHGVAIGYLYLPFDYLWGSWALGFGFEFVHDCTCFGRRIQESGVRRRYFELLLNFIWNVIMLSMLMSLFLVWCNFAQIVSQNNRIHCVLCEVLLNND